MPSLPPVPPRPEPRPAPAPRAVDVTALLDASREGDPAAASAIFPIIYEELHRLAAGYMRNERPDHTLQPTALVHEAFLRLVPGGTDSQRFESRRQFVASAAVAMRRILINHAKAKQTDKRGGDRPRVALDDAAASFEESAVDLLALDDALHKLALLDADQARLVELRFFGGMPIEQCARTLGISERSAQYEWAHARAWLRSQLEGG